MRTLALIAILLCSVSTPSFASREGVSPAVTLTVGGSIIAVITTASVYHGGPWSTVFAVGAGAITAMVTTLCAIFPPGSRLY